MILKKVAYTNYHAELATRPMSDRQAEFLKTRFQEHTRYIKNNDPQSVYAAHILENGHEFGNIADTLTLLHLVNNATLLLPYKQLYIQSHHQKCKLIPEQHNPDPNSILQLACDPT
jgi:hypothetical protein